MATATSRRTWAWRSATTTAMGATISSLRPFRATTTRFIAIRSDAQRSRGEWRRPRAGVHGHGGRRLRPRWARRFLLYDLFGRQLHASSQSDLMLSGLAVNGDGHEQAYMGMAVGDYDRDGRDDFFFTTFSGDNYTLHRNPI